MMLPPWNEYFLKTSVEKEKALSPMFLPFYERNWIIPAIVKPLPDDKILD